MNIIMSHSDEKLIEKYERKINSMWKTTNLEKLNKEFERVISDKKKMILNHPL